MSTIQEKADFLKIVKPIEKSQLLYMITEGLKSIKNVSYNQMNCIGSHNEGFVNAQQANDFFKQLYINWFNNLKTKYRQNQFSLEYAQGAKFIIDNPQYNPSYLPTDTHYDKLFNEIKNVCKGNGLKISIPTVQSNLVFSAPFTNNEDQTSSAFFHVDTRHYGSLRNDEPIEVRLYLNIKAENIIRVAEEILKKSSQQSLPVYFKFTNVDIRSDTLLFYASYATAPKIVDLINKIRNENEELFDGCTVSNPTLGSINDYIGFGEEPVYKNSSFTTERSETLFDGIKGYIDLEYSRIILNTLNTVKTSTGQNLSIEDYLDYVINKNSFANINLSDALRGYLVNIVKRNIKEQIFQGKIPQNFTYFDSTNVQHAFDYNSFNYIEKLCSVHSVKYNPTSLVCLGDLAEQMYSINNTNLQGIQKAISTQMQISLNNMLDKQNLSDNQKKFFSEVLYEINNNSPIGKAIVKQQTAKFIEGVATEKRRTIFPRLYSDLTPYHQFDDCGLIVMHSIDPFFEIEQNLSRTIIVKEVLEKIQHSAEEHDVSKRLNYIFLNESTVKELEQNGIDLKTIGSAVKEKGTARGRQ